MGPNMAKIVSTVETFKAVNSKAIYNALTSRKRCSVSRQLAQIAPQLHILWIQYEQESLLHLMNWNDSCTLIRHLR